MALGSPSRGYVCRRPSRAAEVPGPLDGVRVIDLTTVMMGPYSTQLMAEMGADVIKVESPEGDSVRGIGPARHNGMGAMFLQANKGKRGVALDLKAAADRDRLMALLATADVFVTNVRPQALARLGLDYKTVARAAPRLVFAQLSGFGSEGPYAGRPAYDDLIQGLAGVASLFERSGGEEPRYAPLTLSDRVVGLYAANAVLAALLARGQDGLGQRVEVPMFEAMSHFVLGDHMGGATFEPARGPTGYARLLAPDRKPFRTKDGYVCVFINTDDQWRRFFVATGQPNRLADDPRYRTITSRTEHIQAIYAEVAEALAPYTTQKCLDMLAAADLPAAKMNTVEELLTDPHLEAVGFFEQVEHPSEGALRLPSHPARFSRTPLPKARPAPKLGQHNREVLDALDLSKTAPP